MDRPGSRLSATERLARFLTLTRETPPPVRHQAKRLLVNALAASAAGSDHPAIDRLRAWSIDGVSGGASRILWLGDRTTGDRSALVNGAMLEVLDFNETHLEAFVHPTAPVWPAVQAAGEAVEASLADTLHAFALGVEVELAVATMLMPTHYERGFNPAIAAGGIGAAAGCAVVLGLDASHAADALGLAAMGGGGPLETLGTPAHPYRVGDAARAGFVAAGLAARGYSAPPQAIEGEHGLLATVAEADLGRMDGVLDGLGEEWRTLGPIGFKRYPTETITQAPLEATLTLWEQTPAARRAELTSMAFQVEPLVASVNADRRRRFSVPEDDQQARFDGSYCVAAAWHIGRFTTAELHDPTRTDPAVLALRDRVTYTADSTRTMASAALRATFADGSEEQISVAGFKGSSGNPLSDDELTDKLLECSAGIISHDRALAIDGAVREANPDLELSHFLDLLPG